MIYMTVKIFVDTNVFVYFRDSTDLEKQNMASVWLAQLWQSRTGRISFQILNEYYVTVTRKLKPGLDVLTARADINNLMVWRPIKEDFHVIERGRQLQDKYSISWWDALILSAAHHGNCKILLTEDLQHQQMYGSVKVINPFLNTPAEIRV